MQQRCQDALESRGYMDLIYLVLVAVIFFTTAVILFA
jgi:hypothetical protein